MMSLLRPAVLAAAVFVFAATAAAADKRPMKVDDLFTFKRVAAPQISPDGKPVAYQVTTVDLEENKTTTAHLGRADRRQDAAEATHRPQGQERRQPALVARTATRILFESNRSGSVATVGRRRRRRGEATHRHQHRRRHRHLVAGRHARRVRLGRVPGVQREAVRRERQAEQGEGRGDREEPGEGEGVHEALLPPLGRVRRRQAAAPVRAAGGFAKHESPAATPSGSRAT